MKKTITIELEETAITEFEGNAKYWIPGGNGQEIYKPTIMETLQDIIVVAVNEQRRVIEAQKATEFEESEVIVTKK